MYMPQPLHQDTRDRERVVTEFEERFGERPSLVARAPGRVNLIGDHTDYNDGFVLPMAIDRAVWIAFRKRKDHTVHVHSLDFDERGSFAVDTFLRPSGDRGAWVEYMRGMAWALDGAGYSLRGWEGVVSGDVPLGAGLSSSAALELATARAFAGATGFAWEPVTMARLAQAAENQWVGVNCGIMDQLISAAGVADHALLIDCRSLDTCAVPIPPDIAVVVLDTGTRRGLVDSLYNDRRAQCETAARFFGVPALRDVTIEAFKLRAAELDPITRRRALHVVTENARTLAAADALAAGDVRAVGALMDASHASLRDDFEVSRAELDTMVALACAEPACLGARMTGAGFGGCAVALVDAGEAAGFAKRVATAYAGACGIEPLVYVCAATAGASLEPASDDVAPRA